MNNLQQKTIEELKKLLPDAHFVDVRVRINGQYKFFQADWLMEVLKQFEATP